VPGHGESQPKESEGATMMTVGSPFSLTIGLHLCFRALSLKVDRYYF
jgi:hypothetical protein